MIDFLSLLKDTNAYKIVKAEKEEGRLSHAYLIVSADGKFIKDYLKVFASLIACDNIDPCGKCRTCNLIEQEKSVDVLFYPLNKETVLTEDINSVISESYLKPIENAKKIFVINHAETMTLPAQNKLLKTLEEPPENVIILLGATSEYPVLPTIKSRVKKLEISAFDNGVLYNALKDDCLDKDRLFQAISCGDGTLGTAVSLYQDDGFIKTTEIVKDVLINMNSSREVLEFSNKIFSDRIDIDEFLSVMETTLAETLKTLSGKESGLLGKDIVEQSKGFNMGATVYALDKIKQAIKKRKFNGNPQMVIEWLLFQILEGKFKWQKL